MPEAVGQLNIYLNYYQSEINDEIDNPPIGIILCTDKDNVAAEYALGGLSNQIFAESYIIKGEGSAGAENKGRSAYEHISLLKNGPIKTEDISSIIIGDIEIPVSLEN